MSPNLSSGDALEPLRIALARLQRAPEAERPQAEQDYMQELVSACEECIRRNPAGLEDLTAPVPMELLRVAPHRQQVRYYRAVAAGLRDRLAEAVAQLEALLDEPDLDQERRGRALNAAGLFSQGLGDYQRARDYYNSSQQIWAELGNTLRQGIALTNMGALHYDLHEYDQAERCFLAAAELFTRAESPYHQAQALNELGLLQRDRGNWDAALDYLQRAEALCQQAEAPELRARVVNNQGEVLLLCGEYDAAEAALNRAEAEMGTRVYLVDVHINRGLIAEASGKYGKAIEHYQRALALAGAIERAEVLPLIHYRTGRVYERLRCDEQARSCYAAALAEVEARRAPLRDEGLQIGLMGRWQQIYEAMIRLCAKNGDSAGAFAYAERARARAFADLLARRRDSPPTAGVEPVSAAEACAALEPGDLLLVYVALGLHGPQSELLRAMPDRAAALRTCLEPSTDLFALALTQTRIQLVVCKLDNPNKLESPWGQAGDGGRFLRQQTLRTLDAKLLEPLAPQLTDSQRLIIVPHGPLHQVPFAALCDSAGRALLDRTPRLLLAPSATVLVRVLSARRGAPTRPCLALGYDSPGAGLGQAEAEARAVADILGGAAWCGRPDTLERLREAARDYRVLHLACHGEFLPDDPLGSWLEVGPGQRLSAADVLTTFRCQDSADYGLQADLVTLSACRSGVSRVLRGDEPMGLVRAFLSAGARAVLVTLWRVDDVSSRLLMERFSSELVARGDPAAALRAAQQALRDTPRDTLRETVRAWNTTAELPSGERPYADPQHWAAYVLIGAA